MADDGLVPEYPLYNSTFSAYRISPLYHGSNPLLQSRSLRAHARRLKDILRGDVLRGVDVGFLNVGDKRGSLEDCTWDLVGDEESWERMYRDHDVDEEPGVFVQAPIVNAHEARGIHVQLRYQKATHSALILRDPEKSSQSNLADFTSLPLLLVRMPTEVRETFVDYLSTTFDARVTPLKLHSSFLSSTLETLLQQIDTDASIDSLADVLKGPLQLQLSFPSIFQDGPALLRSIDIRIAQDEVPEFLSRGTQLVTADPSILQPPPSRHSYFAANGTRHAQHPPALTGPFSAALSAYLSSHLALPLSNSSIHVFKLVVPPLVALSSDAKIKLVRPASAPASVRAALLSIFKSLVAYALSAPLAAGIAAGNAAPRIVLPLPRPARARTKTPGKARKSADAATDAVAGLSMQPQKASSRRTQQQQQHRGQKNITVKSNTNGTSVGGGGGIGPRTNGAAAPATKKRRRANGGGGRSTGTRTTVTDGTADAEEEDDDDDLAETSPMSSSSSAKRVKTRRRDEQRKQAEADEGEREGEEEEEEEEEDEDELATAPQKRGSGGVDVTDARSGSSSSNAHHAHGRQYSVPAEPPPPYELHDPARAATVAGR